MSAHLCLVDDKPSSFILAVHCFNAPLNNFYVQLIPIPWEPHLHGSGSPGDGYTQAFTC